MTFASDSGIVTSLAGADDRRAVTVTGEPSVTGFGEADSRTAVVEPSSSPSPVNGHVHCAVTSGSSLSRKSNPAKPA